MPNDDPIVVSGRTFKKATTTSLEQDAYVMSRMRAFGLNDLADSFDPEKGSLHKFAEEVLMKAFDSGCLYEILGGVLIENGVRWTREIAATNALFFAALTNPVDKQIIFDRIADILLDFLLAAVAWSSSSRSFTQLSQPSDGQENQSSKKDISEEPNHTTTESGTVLSAS